MALRESYVSALGDVPRGGRVFVMRHRGHDALAPPADLFAEFKAREKRCRKAGLSPTDAHNQAWDDVHYEERFGSAFWANPAAIEELRALVARARHEDVYFICYEKPPKKCHRFLLLEYAKRL